MKHKFRKYTEEQLKQAIQSSQSISQILTKIGLAPKGGNYRVINNYINENNIDIKHFVGKSWNKGKTFGPKHSTKDYLSNLYPIGSHKLRKRLLSEKVFEPKCSNCELTTWLNKPILLELEHKDGNHKNNQLINLCLLCPNCHAFTSTYRGKNKKKS